MKQIRQRFFNRRSQKALRQHLRNNATPEERKLWTHLRKRSLAGWKFRRQQGIGPYVVDFYCPEARLVVELDGSVHFNYDARQYDQERNRFLLKYGIVTIRFSNSEVWSNIDYVLRTIGQNLNQKK